MNNNYEDFTSDEEDEEVLEQYEDDEEDDEEIIEDEEQFEEEEPIEEEIIEDEEEPVEDEEDPIEDEEDEDGDKSLIDEIFDDKHPQQYSRKREFKINKENILNQINKFKFKSFEDGRDKMKNELCNFTPSDKNVNVFLNNIKGYHTQSWNILRNMFYNTLSLKEILGEIKEEKQQYESILWDKFREIIKKEVMSLQTEIEVIDSFISCPKCKLKKIQFYNVQLRRADEPPTTFNNCMNKHCLYSWRTG